MLRIDASSASRNLATLERHGHVTHRRGPADPRRKLFRLTRTGREKTRAVHRHGDAVMEDAFEYLVPAERRAVCEALGALARAVERSQDPRVEIAPLALCELENLYFTPEVRGGGPARRLVNRALRFAREQADLQVFLETYSGWKAAEGRYLRFGCEPGPRPTFYAEHDVCDRYLALSLADVVGVDPGERAVARARGVESPAVPNGSRKGFRCAS